MIDAPGMPIPGIAELTQTKGETIIYIHNFINREIITPAYASKTKAITTYIISCPIDAIIKEVTGELPLTLFLN